MRIFVAGGTGTLGVPLIRLLRSRGHEVVALTRSETKRPLMESLGADTAVADALDPSGLRSAVVTARPTHVVHLLTALPGSGAPARAADLEPTNRLRVEGTKNLIEAAVAAGATRIVAESFLIVYGIGNHGTDPVDEDVPLLPVRPGQAFGQAIEALRSLESQVLDVDRRGAIEGIVLRYGGFYGPDAPSTRFLVERLQRRRLPLPRDGHGRLPFVHVDDAAAATAASLEQGRRGAVYNVVDDEPVSLAEFARRTAAVVGAPNPLVVPRWLVRLASPIAAELVDLRLPLSNARARRELGWAPRYSTTREGLAQVAGAFHRLS